MLAIPWSGLGEMFEVPHTVSFLSGGNEPDLVLVEPQQRGPPKFVLNPVMQMPAGGKVYSGKGYFNSGAIWGTVVPLPGPAATISLSTRLNLQISLYFP